MTEHEWAQIIRNKIKHTLAKLHYWYKQILNADKWNHIPLLEIWQS